MKMWGVLPATMYAQHLLGEHVELHIIVGTLNRGTRAEEELRRRCALCREGQK